MAFETILTERRGHILIVTMNRPEHGNGLMPKLRSELQQMSQEFKNDDDLWVEILTGAGDDFCLGGDADIMANRDVPGHLGASGRPAPPKRPGLQNRDDGGRINNPKQNHCYKPFIVAVNGGCRSGALHFVVDSDICICSENATFWDDHPSLPSVVLFESIQLARRIPYEAASRMMLMGKFERMNAQRAYQLGLVSEVVPKEKLLDRAVEIAEKIVQSDMYSHIGTIEALFKGQDLGMTQAIHQGLMFRQVQAYNRQIDQKLDELAKGTPA